MLSALPLFWEIAIRSLISIIALFLLTKIIGPRQIAQLTFYDYIIGISLGSIAAAVAIDETIPLWSGIWAMSLYILVSFFMAWSGNKSIIARRFFSGTPKILLAQGKIIETNLRRQNFDLNDLMGYCRSKGYFDISQIEYIIMEVNGDLSILPKSQNAPLTPQDMKVTTAPATLLANVIIDGNVMPHHLISIGFDDDWLEKKLRQQNISKIEDVFLATADKNGNFHCYLKEQRIDNADLFD